MGTNTFMTNEEADRTQKALEALLKELTQFELNENDPRIPEYADRLLKLYVPAFRHRYSKFFQMLLDFDEEFDEKKSEANLDYLSGNILKIRMFVDAECISENEKYRSLYKPMIKLSDHLSLEIARYNRFVKQNSDIEALNKACQEMQDQLQKTTNQLIDATEKLDQANERFNATEDKLNAAETKLNDAEAKLKTIEEDLPTAMSDLGKVKKSLASIHIDIIAVLSIFASIVLTFSGSMTVLGSALTGMQEVHALKATFFVLLCGFVLGNIIFLLMYLVGKLTSRNIYARCKTENCTCGEGGAPECRGLKRIRKRLPYIYWLNLILIVLMAVVVVVWYLDNHYHFIH